MKAAVLEAPGQAMTIQELTLDAPAPDEVVIRTSATGVCHSDLHFLDGAWKWPLPAVLGHETAGVVEEIGAAVTTVKPGDRVVVAFVQSCGRCEQCIRGRPYLCGVASPFGRAGRLKLGEDAVTQFCAVSAFAERMLVNASTCVPIPDGVSMEAAALVGCSVMTGIGAVANTAKVPVGSTVAVVGCGGVGLNVIQGARLAGAARIIAIDVSETKLAAARRFGATDVVDGSGGDAARTVRQMTDGGVDFAFEAIGLIQTAQQCFDMLRKAGTAVIVGMLPRNGELVLRNAGLAFLDEKAIKGSYYGSTRPAYDMPWLMELARQGRIDIDGLVSHRFGLGQVNEAFDQLRRGELTRGVVVFER